MYLDGFTSGLSGQPALVHTRPRRATKGHACRRGHDAAQGDVREKCSQNDSQRHRRQPSANLRQYTETPMEERGAPTLLLGVEASKKSQWRTVCRSLTEQKAELA